MLAHRRKSGHNGSQRPVGFTHRNLSHGSDPISSSLIRSLCLFTASWSIWLVLSWLVLLPAWQYLYIACSLFQLFPSSNSLSCHSLFVLLLFFNIPSFALLSLFFHLSATGCADPSAHSSFLFFLPVCLCYPLTARSHVVAEQISGTLWSPSSFRHLLKHVLRPGNQTAA